MPNSLFVTGTDTGVGKTLVTGLLAKSIQQKNKSVVTQKWCQSGLDGITDIEKHLALRGENTEKYQPFLNAMCPYRFSLAASPHLASREENKTIEKSKIITSFSSLKKHFDWVIVEGSGGFLTPFSAEETLADIVFDLELPVVLVIDNKLGCINHSLLTLEAIQSRGLECKGLIFTQTEKNQRPLICEDNIKIISSKTNASVLGVLPYTTRPEQLVLDLSVFESIV